MPLTAAQAWKGTRTSDNYLFDDDDTFDFVMAGHGDDTISDALNGQFWSSDFFHGQSGSDTLVSTGGHDVLRGGKGDDIFDVTAGFYETGTLPGGWQDDSESGPLGFDVMVSGGIGHDLLTLRNSEGYTIEYRDDLTIIHTAQGGTITVEGVEEFQFL